MPCGAADDAPHLGLADLELRGQPLVTPPLSAKPKQQLDLGVGELRVLVVLPNTQSPIVHADRALDHFDRANNCTQEFTRSVSCSTSPSTASCTTGALLRRGSLRGAASRFAPAPFDAWCSGGAVVHVIFFRCTTHHSPAVRVGFCVFAMFCTFIVITPPTAFRRLRGNTAPRRPSSATSGRAWRAASACRACHPRAGATAWPPQSAPR